MSEEVGPLAHRCCGLGQTSEAVGGVEIGEGGGPECARLQQHFFGKEKVPGSNPGVGSMTPANFDLVTRPQLGLTPHCQIPGPELGSG